MLGIVYLFCLHAHAPNGHNYWSNRAVAVLPSWPQALHPCLVATLVWQLPAFGARPAAKPVRPCHRSSAAMEPLPSSVLAVDKPPPPSVLMALLRNHYWDRRFEELGLRSCGWGFRNSRDRGGVRALDLSLRLAHWLPDC